MANKLPVILCILSGIFCLALAVLLLTFPKAQYTAQLEQAQANLTQAQQELAEQTAAAEASLADITASHAGKTAALAELTAVREEKETLHAAKLAQLTELQHMPATIVQLQEDYGNKIRQLEEMIMAEETDVRICYLTFDDGPNNLTSQVVNKLNDMGVYATFFTVGRNTTDRQLEKLREEMMGGHTVANHTWSHAFDWGLYGSLEEFKFQVQKQHDMVYEATGFHMNLFRFPSGSMLCPFVEEAEAWLAEQGYQWIDWNASAWDSGVDSWTATGQMISNNVLRSTKDLDIAVVLCHDWNSGTYNGLDIFVPKMRDSGFIFLPLFPQSHMLDEPLPVV